jgi:hypothetical protein
MSPDRRTAAIVGALFLTVMVAWFIGTELIESILNAPDYLLNVYPNRIQVIVGVLFELIEVAAVVGIAVMMFPILKQYNERIALGYVVFRILECAMLIVAAISPLLLITLSQEYLNTGALDASSFQALGTLFVTLREHWSLLILAIFYCLAALMFYYVLYQTKLIPRFISVWGLTAATMALTTPLLGTLLGIPMGLNEVFLGIWLIAKGFNPSAIASESRKRDINEV